ncbi:MAG: hypothetical protein H7Z72_17365 [Bacteroidetes bacterium]|nr:hypothetical protein [Fibrella sp.]
MNHITKLVLLSALLTSSVAFGQITADPEERQEQGRDPLKTQTPEGRPLPFSQRLRFGGGITGLRFGNPTSLGASPVVAYQASERLIVGIGLSYTYTRYKPPFYNATTLNQYSGRGFVMYEFIPTLVRNLYLHGEIENSTVQVKYDDFANQNRTIDVAAPLVGLTYSQPISRRFGFNITALYNLNYSAGSNSGLVYGSPYVFRVSFF